MKIVQINGCSFGSTGKIMFGISEVARENGFAVKCVYPVTSVNKNKTPAIDEIRIGTHNSRRFNILIGRITGLSGRFSYIETYILLKKLDEFKPDIIQLHNLHESYINLSMLFNYINKNNIKIFWTLHDCWAFTGHCAHFDYIGCDKWKTKCEHCQLKKAYPKSYFADTSEISYKFKKKLFTSVKNMTIITPSKWLAELTEQSFLNKYPIKVIYNGIDLRIFKPSESDFVKKYSLKGKKIVLSLASVWTKNKGIADVLELSNRLKDDYKFVVVGSLSDTSLPENIIYIPRTESQTELAEIYTAADIFINPTYEDNFPTVNIESLACGTPVITYNTGGSPEALDDTCGAVVERGNIDEMEKEIKRVCEERPYSEENCLSRAKMFDMNDKFKEYVELYKSLQI